LYPCITKHLKLIVRVREELDEMLVWYDQRVQESSSDVAKITDLKQLNEMAASIREQQASFYARRAASK